MNECQTCRHYNQDPSGRGTCRRYAPRPMAKSWPDRFEQPVHLWPIVAPDAWCGEYEDKTKPKTTRKKTAKETK